MNHIPVMLNHVLDVLKSKKINKFLDCTIGAGGHAKALLSNHSEMKTYIGIDTDGDAIQIAKENLQEFANKTEFINMNFKDISEKSLGKFDAIMMDIGVSSMQLDDSQRGFSFKNEGPLDMRMNQHQQISAYHVVNFFKKEKLKEIFTKYEVIGANRIIDAIVKNRPINTTAELSEIIEKALSVIPRRNVHKSTLAFQAIRIFVNAEDSVLDTALQRAFEMLNHRGVLIVISFHSIEDRIVKMHFKHFSGKSEQSKDPYTGHPIILGDEIFSKPLFPSEEEIRKNPRSRSAKMRVISKR